MEIYSKELKPYKGFQIEKSWTLDRFGRQTDICYMAYTDNGNGVYDGASTLSELKKNIDVYLRG